MFSSFEPIDMGGKDLGFSPAQRVRHRDDNWKNKLGRHITEPQAMRFGQADDAHRYQAPDCPHEDTESEQVNERCLATNRPCRPNTYRPHGKIYARQEAVHVIESRRRVGFAQIHL